MAIVISRSSLDLPSSSEKLFGRDAPLVGEIGVGSGQFMEALSKRHPEWNVLGIDRAPDSVVRTFRRLRRAGTEHARVMMADATFVLRDVIPRHGLQALYINFPDPWPRRKHQDRRLLQSSLLRLISTRLEGDGRVYLTSDHPGFFTFACTNASETGFFRVEEGDAPAESLETKYAHKWKDRDLEIFHAALIKTGEAEDHGPNIELVDGMHHAVLHGELPDLTGFEKVIFSFRTGTVVVLEAYRTLDGSGYAFLVHVEEMGLNQEIIVETRPGKNGYVLGIKRFGEPLQTRGLRHAVRCLTEWMESQGMTVIHRKY